MLPLALLIGATACERSPVIAEEHVAPGLEERAHQAQSPTKTEPPRAAGPGASAPSAALPWETSKPPTESERLALRAFYTNLDAKSFQEHFRVAPPREQVAEASRAHLRGQMFLLELPVRLGPHREGVFLERDGKTPSTFRWVWPVDVGGEIFLVRHKPRVNAGTSSKQLRKTNTWLLDAPKDQALLQEIQARPNELKFRALWQPRGARTDRYPVLVVRVVGWQLLFGDRVLHTETDDR